MSVVALSGGVGGAKLALGLYRVLPPDTLTVVVNTGDDFDHFGLRICPDLDTVLYTLGGLASRERGWGREDETWALMGALESLGADTWFRLGDADTALHLARTQHLNAGESLAQVIDCFRRRLGISAQVLPMSDDRVATIVQSGEGVLPFQEYFVRRRCEPAVEQIRFDGASRACVPAAVRQAFSAPDLDAIVICPSNPYLSIDPLLAVPELRALLERRRVPCIAVSPLIGGQAVKGPTAKIMGELGIEISNHTIVDHYRTVIDGIVVDTSDAVDASRLATAAFAHPTLMTSDEDRMRLARFVLDCASRLSLRNRQPLELDATAPEPSAGS